MEVRLALALGTFWCVLVLSLYAALNATASPGSDFATWWKGKYNAASAVKGWQMHTDTIACANPVKHLYKCRLVVTDNREGAPKKVFCALALIKPDGSIAVGHAVPCQKTGVA